MAKKTQASKDTVSSDNKQFKQAVTSVLVSTCVWFTCLSLIILIPTLFASEDDVGGYIRSTMFLALLPMALCFGIARFVRLSNVGKAVKILLHFPLCVVPPCLVFQLIQKPKGQTALFIWLAAILLYAICLVVCLVIGNKKQKKNEAEKDAYQPRFSKRG